MRQRSVLSVSAAWVTVFGWVPLAALGAAASRPATTSAPARAIDRVLLVTVTDTSAVLTWETSEPADGLVRYGTQRDRLDQTAPEWKPKATSAPSGTSGGWSRFHYCELRGLRPGTRYDYFCQSGQARSNGGTMRPAEFTTLVPPRGRELFSFATMTDTHVGEPLAAGLTLRGKVINPGVRWREPGLPFWRLTLESSIREINAASVAFTIIKGDVTHGIVPEEFSAALRILSELDQPYHVVHGNHDVTEAFLRTFDLQQPWYSFDQDGMHFIVLDTEPLAGRNSDVLGQQFGWLAADLKSHPGEWSFVFLHRPVLPKLTRESGEPLSEELLRAGSGLLNKMHGSGGATHIIDQATGQAPNVVPANAVRLAELLRSHGHIAGVFAGHLHRNYVGYWPEETGNLPYVETASTKEYPCGYAITRVFTGGYMQNYYVPRDLRCLEWSAMTQDAYARIGFQSKAGSLAERNFVVRFEDLKLSPVKPGSRPGEAAQPR